MRIPLAILCFSLAPAALVAGTSHDQQNFDAGKARQIAANCTSCHDSGKTNTDGIRPLAGMSHDLLVDKMLSFKNAKTPSTMAFEHAKRYSDEDIELLAGYFAGSPRSNM